MIGKSSGDNDSEIDRTLLAVSRGIDRKLGRAATGFNQDQTATARRYYPSYDWQKTLFVDDVASKTGLVVKIDDNQDGTAEVTLAETTDFELLPYNADKGPEPIPWNQLFLPPKRVARISWDALVEVTAIYGWPKVPAVVVDATIQLTAIWRLESPRATNRISEGFDALIGTSRKAQNIIDELLAVYAKKRDVVHA